MHKIFKLEKLLGGVQYCILHNSQSLPDHESSDLDIVVTPSDLPALERNLFKAEKVRIVQMVHYEATGYHFDLAVWQDDVVGSFPLDVVKDFRMGFRVWFSAYELLENKQQWNGFWVASPEVEFKYLLVKKILKQSISDHAKIRLRELALFRDVSADSATKRLLGVHWGSKVIRWIRDGKFQKLEASLPILKKVLKREQLRKDPINAFRYWLPELQRIWQRWRHPCGLWVTVLGPDGAGKSTLIERLREKLQGPFHQMVQFHFLPQLIPKRDDDSPVTDPQGKPPRSIISSVIKLVYYFLEYTVGYLIKVRPAIARPTLVLFDRYYHDLLVDPKRYRYGAPQWLAEMVGRFIPKPDLWLILDVPEEEILRRKQEVPLEEIRRQRMAYRRLASELSNAYLLDGSQTPKEVAQQAVAVILDFLYNRYKARRHIWFPNVRQQDDLGWLREALGATENLDERKAQYVHLSLPDGRGYLLPCNSRRAAVAGLSLYSAQKPKAITLKNLLSIGLRIGMVSRVLPKVAINLEPLRNFLMGVFKRKDLSLSVSLGTPGPHRKPVVQVTSEAGEVLGYVKVGWNDATRALVKNEAVTLKRLTEHNLPFLVPCMLFAGEWLGKTLCIQSPPLYRVRKAPRKLNSQYVKAVKGLADTGVQHYSLEDSPFWKELEKRRKRITNNYWKNLLNKGMTVALEVCGGREVPFHLAHGDFTPWNVFESSKGIYLFDWEYAEGKPAGFDLFHFQVQTKWLVEGKSPGNIIGEVLNLPKEEFYSYFDLINMSNDDMARLLYLYLLDRLSFYSLEEFKDTVNVKLLDKLLYVTEVRL